MSIDWTSQESAIGMRDVIAAIAETRIEALRPSVSYAVVQQINREARSAKVLYMGDTTPVTVAMGSIEPATTGQTVRIGGTLGHRYIEDVLGNAIMSGNDERYAEVGHTHAGGGAIALNLDDLGDVDLTTNPPTSSSILGYNAAGGKWQPISIDLGTSYLPLTGGTLSGAVTFQAAVTANTTLNVLGAVTGQSFSGVGTNLTNLNATALTSGLIPVARFPSTIGSNTTGTAAAWTTGRLLTVTGDMTGSATIKGDADINLAVALQPNSIALGADTTGNYVAHIIGTANQIISDTVVANEGTIHTLSLPQSIGTTATPTFARMTLSQATGTAPLTVTSTTMVANLTANYLGAVAQDAAFFRSASNLNAGTVNTARIAGPYTGITQVGTLTSLTVTGAAAFTATPTVGGQNVWHAGNDGAGSGLDAGLLGGVLPAGYASTEIMESLMGDLLAVGLYDAARYNGDLLSIVFDRSVQQSITGLTIPAGDDPLSMSFALNLPIIPQADVATGANRRRIIRNVAFLDIIRTGDDDYLNRTAGYARAVNTVDVWVNKPVVFRARLRKTSLAAVGIKQIARHGTTDGEESWKLYMDTGRLMLRVGNPDNLTLTTIEVLSAVELDAIAGTADGTDFYVAVSVTPNGTLLTVQGWGSVNGTTWTTAAIPKTTAFPYPTLFASADPIYIGGQTTGEFWDGRIYWVDMLDGTDPNLSTGNPIFRFAATDHPYGGTVNYSDPYNRAWILSTTTTLVHATFTVRWQVTTSGGTRVATTAPFSYFANAGRPWHIRGTWDPITDTLAVAQRNGEDLGLTDTGLAWSEVATVFAGDTMSTTIGATIIGQGVSGALNWSYGGQFHRALIVKNGAPILDLRNTDLTSTTQTTITPTVGPVMTFSHAGMAQTTMPTPKWAEGPTVYRHNMYWIVASTGEVDFIDSDFSGRYDVDIDDAVMLSNGDWVIAIDPLFGAPGHLEGANLTLSQMIFQYIPFSTETYIKNALQEHSADPLDPHSAAGYLKAVIANSTYAAIVHTHAAEISDYITLHEQESDPHPQYLSLAEANGLYLKPGDIQPYEPQGAVLAHEQKPDPHPQYTTHAEANAAYAVVDHNHDTKYAQTGHTHADSKEVLSTDGANSSRIFIGEDPPVNPLVGDLWVVTFDISLQAPGPPANLTVAATGPSSITLNWNAWDPSIIQTGVQVERSPDGTTGWTTVLNDISSPFETTYTDSGRNERTTYFYRVRAVNAIGSGTFGNISAATTNAPPATPGSLTITNVTSANMRLNWAAVTNNAWDPLHATQPYEVFKNGVSQGFTTGLFWDFGGMTENTTASLGVRSKDNLSVTSSIAALSGTTSNAAPPAPTGLYAVGVNHYQFHMGWTGVSGIADFNRYQVFVNGGFWADAYGTDYLFSGLSPSTTYTFGVRTVDNSSAVSGIVSMNATTSVNPDTTPPAPPTFHSWRPRNNYGEMYFEFSAPGDIAYGEIFYNVNGAGWVRTYAGGLGGYHLHYNGTHGANQTIYAAVNYRDAAGNWYNSPAYAYTLVPSPTTFAPHSSNSWRNSNGGEWNAPGGYRPVQGYFSNSALNSYGFWFYGTDFSNWWQGGRQITQAQIFINREGCGINQQDWVYLGIHDMTASPGTTSFWGNAVMYGGVGIGTVQYGESKWMDFDVGWANELVTGVHRGLGIGGFAGGKPYLCLHPAGVGYSGTVLLYHLG